MTFRALALAGAATLVAAPAFAQNERYTPMQANDPLYTCDQLMQEASVMEDELGAAPGGAFGGIGADQAIGIGTDLAVRAGGATAARALGALGGLGGLARGAAEQQRAADEARKEMAQDRWYYLAGLYMGKSCHEPQAAAVPPAPVPVAAEPLPAASVPAEPVPAGPAPAAQ